MIDPNEKVFTLADVKKIFQSQKKRFIRLGFIGALLAFLFAASRPPQYKIEASFKEGEETTVGRSDLIKEMIGTVSQTQPQTMALIQSFPVLKPLVERLGLQIKVKEKRGIFTKFFQRLTENYQAEKEKPLKDLDPFTFQKVSYEGETPLKFFLLFSDAEHFSLYAKDKKTLLAKSSLDDPISLPEIQFTLKKVPKAVRLKTFYNLEISPWISVVKKLHSELQISSQKANKTIYDLAFYHRDRFLGAHLLNELMIEYQDYLKREHNHLASAQLAYLEQRQNDLYSSLSHVFNEHETLLEKNLEKSGCLGFGEERTRLLSPYQEMMNRLFSIEMDLATLGQFKNGRKPIAFNEKDFFSRRFNQLSQKMQELEQQRDLLELSLQPDLSFAFTNQRQREKLREIRSEKEGLQDYLKGGLSSWAEKLWECEEPKEREDLAKFLENYARLLSVRENKLQERVIYGNEPCNELEGIDLEAARSLFVNYNTKLDQEEANIRYYSQLRATLPQSDFELSSLSAVLTDPLSQNLISHAGRLALQLKDEKYRSSKEEGRWKEEVLVQKKVLADHLDQLLKVAELNRDVVREKIKSLQQVSLDCIHGQISVLQSQMEELISEQEFSLLSEKNLLKKKIEELRIEALKIPEEWKSEKWLEFKTEMAQSILTALTELIESKTISHNLHHIESKPLDWAVPPLLPEKPSLWIKTFLGAFFLGFGSFFATFLRSILKGFPTSTEKILAMKLPFLGSITPFCDGPQVETVQGNDLDTLRKMALFFEETKAKIIALIGSKGPDYSYALGENLGRTACKSIILRLDFGEKFKEEDQPGLVQMWNETILPIRKGKGFDWIPSGGHTPYGVELVKAPFFSKILNDLQTQYDRIFLYLKAPLSSSDAQALLTLSQAALVTISGEFTEELTPFIDWAYHENRYRLKFMTIA